jgi:hypothetical protein
MKKIFTFLAVMMISMFSGQNIMHNGGFETYTNLPDNWNELNRCSGWSNCNGNYATQGSWGSPDFLSTSGTGVALLPCGYVACVNPHSGNNVAGFITYNGFNVNNREYIRNYFNTPMIVGEQYLIEFYLTIGSSTIAKYATNNVGIRVSVDSTWQFSPYQTLPQVPQMNVNTLIDSIGWKKYSFTFTADSAYKYITFGNYKTDGNTTLVVKNASSNQLYAYYAIDDIAVTRISGVGLKGNSTEELSAMIFPNPSDEQLSIKGRVKEKITVFNELGQPIRFIDLNETNNFSATIKDLAKGVYFIKGQYTSKKVVIVR